MVAVNGFGSTRRNFVRQITVGAIGLKSAVSSAHPEAAPAPALQSGQGKYGKWLKPLTFEDWQGPFRQITRHTSEFPNLHVEYGTPAVAGRIGTPEVHDFDQVLIFMGSDPRNIGDLGAQVELCLGSGREKHMITTSTAVFVPKGTPHMPATTLRMDRRFILMTISNASQIKAAPAPAPAKEYAGEPIAGLSLMRSKFRDNIPIMLWERKGAWHYGAQNPDDAEGYITSINGNSGTFNFHMMYESINKGPYRFGDPYKPHVHAYDESLIFIGTDCNDLAKLPGEAEMCMGTEAEMERYRFSTPTLIHLPKGFQHCPLVIARVDKPFIFVVLQAFGN